ncbi:MAG: amino acid permease [Saprospiraceae bacterium]
MLHYGEKTRPIAENDHLSGATILVVSSVIGSGVYKSSAYVRRAAFSRPGSVGLCAGWNHQPLGALSNAEIAGMMADSGGEFVYFRRIYGRFVAFLWGWSTFVVIKTAAVASIAYVFSQSFNAIIPLPHLPAFH